jgi:hypothetical protein
MSEPKSAVDPMVDWRAAIREFGVRLERDYVDRVSRFARGFGVWGNSTSVGYEIPLGGRVGKLAGSKAHTLDELVFSVSLVAASASAISPISKASSDEN